jgi:hypothetical protein
MSGVSMENQVLPTQLEDLRNVILDLRGSSLMGEESDSEVQE